MHVYICVYICIHVYIYTYICMHEFSLRRASIPSTPRAFAPSSLPRTASMRRYIQYTDLFARGNMCMCVCVCVYSCVRAYSKIWIYVYLYVWCIYSGVLYCLIPVNVHVIHIMRFFGAVRYRRCEMCVYISYMYAYVRSHSCNALRRVHQRLWKRDLAIQRFPLR